MTTKWCNFCKRRRPPFKGQCCPACGPAYQQMRRDLKAARQEEAPEDRLPAIRYYRHARLFPRQGGIDHGDY